MGEKLMTEIVHLQPHDPLPDYGLHCIVLKRFGEDDPNSVVTEIAFSGPDPVSLPAVHRDGSPMGLDDATRIASVECGKRGIKKLYVVDRTAGRREQEVIHHHGDHSTHSETLDDTDEEDGVTGSSLLDRKSDAGFMR
jgi:hypothetical protein